MAEDAGGGEVVTFIKDFDHQVDRHTITAYRKGMTLPVSAACAAQARAKGAVDVPPAAPAQDGAPSAE